ncbi:tyrosine-type recombinase/integrase, partial [Candidatus Dojkabacteria bacterium]|nr:tyrosine-type recombinase/integrase [Candidatus Dojkabacteria bacterium]
ETLENYARDLEIFGAFLSSRRIDFAKVDKLTISEYKGFLRNQNYIPILHKYKLGQEITDADEQKSKLTSERKQALYKGRLASRSVNRMLSSLRSYLNFLVDIDEPVPIPPSAIKLIKTEKKEKQVAELGELVKLIECPMEFEKQEIVQLRNRAILELIFATGMRISEVVNLDLEQIRFKEGKILDDRVYILGKGKKQRFVYLTPRATIFLEEYLQARHDDYPAMFIPTKGTRKATDNPYIIRLSQNYIQAKIAEYRRRLGIIVPTSAHSLRHGFATYLAEEGASPAAIQKLLGHESLQTTTRYVHASDKFAESAHRKFHPLADVESAEPTVPETQMDTAS